MDTGLSTAGISLKDFVDGLDDANSTSEDRTSRPPSEQNRRLGPLAKLGPRRIAELIDGYDLDSLNIASLSGVIASINTLNYESLNNVDTDGYTWSMKIIDNGVIQCENLSTGTILYLQGSVTNPDP